MKVLVAAVVAVCTFVVAPFSASANSLNPIARATQLMSLTYQQFASVAHEQPFEWSTDGCSFLGTPEYFTPACVQHDFGYRNFGSHYEIALNTTREVKDWIDDRFLEEMNRICSDTGRGVICTNLAAVIHAGVHFGGDSSFF